MARTLIVKIIGDASALQREFKKSSAAASKFDRDMTRTSRSTATASASFRSIGRSVAFATGGLVAFGGAAEFLRESIDAAREAQVAHRSLAAQMKASGESFEANRDRIEKVSRSYLKFGFENDEVVKSLTVLERGTGNINRAISLQGLTADLARAKNIDLAAAAQTVAKVFGGQETALRRAVPGLAQNAHGMDLIRLAQQRLAGQAAANTTAAERFAATLHDTKEIIGTALLPTIDHYLDKASTWLSDTENQEKLQRNLNSAVEDGAAVLGAFAEALGFVKSAWDALPDFGKNQGLLEILGLRGGGGKGDFGKGVSGGGGDFAIRPRRRRGRRAAARPDREAGSLRGRFNIAALQLARAGLTQTLSDDRKILVVEKGILEQQVAQAKTLKEKTALTEQLAGVTGQIRSIDEQRTAELKRQTTELDKQTKSLKEQADAIKAAVVDRLRERQSRIQDQRAIRDAQEQLREARALGGRVGIRQARQAVTDAKMQALINRLQAAPATLTRGGQFALGTVVTINVHGVTDPDAVAKKVTDILQRRGRHTSAPMRGPAAGSHAGAH